MKKLREIMYGRYGTDQLSKALLLIGVILALIGQLTKKPLFSFISYVPLLISIYRMFSKDISNRSMENYKFTMYLSTAYSRYKKMQKQFKERKTHKYYKCPNCKTELRLPKGKGKIIITCPKCKDKFEKRT